MVESALKVPKDVFRDREMEPTGVVHVEAHLLDRVGDIRPGEGEVLESPGHATVGSLVGDGGLPCRRRPWPECQPAWNHSP
jgi:hypothetical protein